MDNQRIRDLNWKFGIINGKIKIKIFESVTPSPIFHRAKSTRLWEWKEDRRLDSMCWIWYVFPEANADSTQGRKKWSPTRRWRLTKIPNCLEEKAESAVMACSWKPTRRFSISDAHFYFSIVISLSLRLIRLISINKPLIAD